MVQATLTLTLAAAWKSLCTPPEVLARLDQEHGQDVGRLATTLTTLGVAPEDVAPLARLPWPLPAHPRRRRAHPPGPATQPKPHSPHAPDAPPAQGQDGCG